MISFISLKQTIASRKLVASPNKCATYKTKRNKFSTNHKPMRQIEGIWIELMSNITSFQLSLISISSTYPLKAATALQTYYHQKIRS